MRDDKLDILRSFGITLIIFAHSSPPEFLFQARNFDVCLLVLISGIAYSISGHQETYLNYLWKRIKRLVIPVWIYLLVYLLLIRLTGTHVGELTGIKILASFSLNYGYGWIIRVYVLVAVGAPFLGRLSGKIQSNRLYISVVFVLFVAYEVLVWLTEPLTAGLTMKIISLWIYYGIAYTLVFSVGLRWNRLGKSDILLLSLLTLVCLSVLGTHYYFSTSSIPSFQDHKYPPTLYFLSYGLIMSILCLMIVNKLQPLLEKRKNLIVPVLFIGRNSLWIYLWHTVFVEILRLPLHANFPIRFFWPYSAAVLLVLLQRMIVKKLVLPLVGRETTRNNITMILIG